MITGKKHGDAREDVYESLRDRVVRNDLSEAMYLR